MGIIMIIFWVLIIGGIILLISGVVNGIRGTKHYQDDALKSIEILKQRYAHGEIEKAEFENKRRDLSI